MLEISRPEAKATLTWIAVWLIALIALALVPMDGPKTGVAGLPDEIHYSHSTKPITNVTDGAVTSVRG